MDDGSGITIMYAETMEKMGIPLSRLRPTLIHFHGIVQEKKALSLGQITLEVVFGTPYNFCAGKLCFEMVAFKREYHALFGQPSYAKFMANPCYAYLKLKMPGPKGMITIAGCFKNAHSYEVTNVNLMESELAAS